MIRFGSCRRAAFETLRAHLENWRTAERWLSQVSHHLNSHAIIPADVQRPRTDQCPIVLHQAPGPAPCSSRSAGSRMQARRACAQRFGVVCVTSAYREWRNPRNWWLRNADGCFSSDESAMACGCFPEVASGREKAIKIACAGRSRKNFRNSNLDAFRLWKEVKAKNRRSGRKMSDAIFVTAKASGRLTIGDRKEIDKATWRKPRGTRLTPTSRYIRDKLFPKSH